MFQELSEVGKARTPEERRPLTQRGGPGREAPSAAVAAAAEAGAAVWERLLCAPLAGFVVVRAPPPVLVQAWLATQALLLLLHSSLYWEVGGHAATFDTVVQTACAAEHIRNGKCIGPSWELSDSKVLNFGARGARAGVDWTIGADRSFTFSPKSCPPTFLVGVEPQPPHGNAAYAIAAWCTGGFGTVEATEPTAHGTKFYLKPSSGAHSDVVSAPNHTCGQQWRVDVTLHSTHSSGIAVSAYALDATVSHLEQISASSQCDFKTSWAAFEDAQGWRPSSTLRAVQRAAAAALLVGAALAFRVHTAYARARDAAAFASAVAAKYWLVDVPLQVCFLCYLWTWYRTSGVRCQLCLFDPQHCVEEHPLHSTNGLLCAVTVVSCLLNQLLVVPKTEPKDEDEAIGNCCARFALFSVAALPFAVGVLAISASTLHIHSVWLYIILTIPLMVSCVAFVVTVDEGDDMW